MFFNLDAYNSNRQGAKSSDWYSDKIQILMKLDVPFVILTDKEFGDKIPECPNIKKIIMKFTELEAYLLVDKVTENRKNDTRYVSSRETPEFFCTMVSKSEAMLKAINYDPFNSEVFCWMDMGYYRDHSYITYSLEQLAGQLQKLINCDALNDSLYHLGLINWIPKNIYSDLSQFYTQGDGGPCTIEGGFHFGGKDVAKYIHRQLLCKYREHVLLGYGHADEQLMFYVSLENRDKIVFYSNDYFCGPFNCLFPMLRVHCSTSYLLPSLLRDEEYALASDIATKILAANQIHNLRLPTDQIKICNNALNDDDLHSIDKIIYINLDKRRDRRRRIEEEFKRMGIPPDKIERFAAIDDEKRPRWGCHKSHLQVLEIARNRGYKNVLVLEDDFQFIVEKQLFYSKVSLLNSLDYDVVMLSYSLQGKQQPFNDTFGKLIEAQTASGYLVHSRFYDKLIETLSDGLLQLKKTGNHGKFCNDQCWKKLQPTSKWFYYLRRIGKQGTSYSDIERSMVDYGL